MEQPNPFAFLPTKYPSGRALPRSIRKPRMDRVVGGLIVEPVNNGISSMLNFDFSSSDAQAKCAQAESVGLSQYELGRCEAKSIYRKQIIQERESYESRIKAYEERLKELELKRYHEVATLVKDNMPQLEAEMEFRFRDKICNKYKALKYMAEVEADLAECEKELEDHVSQIQTLKYEITSLRRKNKKLENSSRVLELEAQIQRLGAENYSMAAELRKLRAAAHGPKEDAQEKFEKVCRDVKMFVLKKDEYQISCGEVSTTDGEMA